MTSLDRTVNFKPGWEHPLNLQSMLFYLISVGVAFFLGALIQPAFRKEGGHTYFYYSAGAGNRNKKKLW